MVGVFLSMLIPFHTLNYAKIEIFSCKYFNFIKLNTMQQFNLFCHLKGYPEAIQTSFIQMKTPLLLVTEYFFQQIFNELFKFIF